MRLRFTLRTNKLGSEVEYITDVDDEEWDDLSGWGREKYAREIFWAEALTYMGDWDYEELD